MRKIIPYGNHCIISSLWANVPHSEAGLLVVRTRPVSFALALRRLSLFVVNWEGVPKEMEQGAYSKQGDVLPLRLRKIE